MNTWIILDRTGLPVPEGTIPERSDDANPSEGNVYTPWYRTEEHLHIEEGKIVGIHAQGSLPELQPVLRFSVEHEAKVFEGFDPRLDSLPLLDVLKWLIAVNQVSLNK